MKHLIRSPRLYSLHYLFTSQKTVVVFIISGFSSSKKHYFPFLKFAMLNTTNGYCLTPSRSMHYFS